MQASSIAEQLTGEFRLARKPWRDFRPLILVTVYFALYMGLSWGVRTLGPSSPLTQWHLAAGFGLGLLSIYGLRAAPLVLAASLADNLWIFGANGSITFIGLKCLILILGCTMAASILRHIISGSVVSLKHSEDIAKFVITGAVASFVLAIVSSAIAVLDSLIQWQDVLPEFARNLIGFGTGILAITPFLIIHSEPSIQKLLWGIYREKLNHSRYLDRVHMDKRAALFAISFLALASLSLWLMLRHNISGALPVFLLFSLPLVWIAMKSGLEGLSIAVPALTGIMLVAYRCFGKDADAVLAYQMILLAASFNSFIIGAGVTEVAVAGTQMQRKDAILEAVSFAAQEFLGKSGWESGLQEVMKRLGDATSVTRVFITERVPQKGSQLAETLLYEWTTQGLNSDENDRHVLNLLRRQLIEEQASALSFGQPYVCLTREIDPKKQDMLETLGVRSVVIVPMFVDRQWWGCLGLEQCFVDREWPASEVDGLKMAGQILGTLIASVRVEQQFRQLTGNIQAVFWISGPDGRSKQYVSPGYEEIWGRSCASLQRQPASWLEAIHKEDRGRIEESLVKQSWGEYDEEYRLVRPDNSVRWVHDRAFPVRDQGGQVFRIVGISEDITNQKKIENQLRTATAMLSSLIDHLQSGVVVEDEARHITHVNQAFNDLFNLPVPAQSLFGVDARLLFRQPLPFVERMEEIIEARTPVLGEEVQWQDRLFLRNYIPLSVSEDYRYHLWQYHDITVSRYAEEQIKASLKEKEVLLKEIHHRVKNNLQIISSLLSLQGSEILDPKASQRFKESQDRVKAMALIHERLYQSPDLAKIDFAGYVRNLTGHLVRSYRVNSNAIRLNMEVESVPMNLDVAIPCGLIINELVSNALKYAFPDGSGGEIQVRFGEQNGHGLRLTVKDSGIGFPAGMDPENSDSLGLKLVRSLTEQLGGSVSFCSRAGLQCDITIPRSGV
jgi:PAS domain S-box-containing protein